MTDQERAVMQQALEALERNVQHKYPLETTKAIQLGQEAITALKAALAQEEGRMEFSVKETVCAKCGSTNGAHSHDCPVAKAALAQQEQEQEQEPVAWMLPRTDSIITAATKVYRGVLAEDYTQPLFTHPPRREWVNLTEEEIGDVFQAARNAKLGSANDNSRHRLSVVEISRAIEAALKERST